MTAMQRHLDAIRAGEVTKTNVIGLRKAVNHVARLERGWSGNRSAATGGEVREALDALAKLEPRVAGELVDSGKKLLQSPRYRKRLSAVADIVASLDGFRLVRFDWIDATHVIPVYRATSPRGSFLFRNIPWQTAYYQGAESGPVLVGESD